MSRNTIEKSKRRFIAAKIEEKYQEGKREGRWNSEEAFGECLDPPAARSTVSQWRREKITPSAENIKSLIDLFGVSEDYFDIEKASDLELYKYDSLTITKVGSENIKVASKNGLRPDLVEALSKLIDFDTLFPLYTPIEHVNKDPETGSLSFDRDFGFLNSAPIENSSQGEKLRYLQIDRDGKRITLNIGDLMFLKEVQDQITKYVKFMFYDRAREMEDEVKQFNQDLIEVKVNGKTVSDPKVKEEIINKSKCELAVFDSPEELKKALQEARNGSKSEEIEISYKTPTEDYKLAHDRFYQFFIKNKEGKKNGRD